MKQPFRDAVVDRVASIPKLPKLLPRHNPVLTAHQRPCFP